VDSIVEHVDHLLLERALLPPLELIEALKKRKSPLLEFTLKS